jgi:hypothetical protein
MKYSTMTRRRWFLSRWMLGLNYHSQSGAKIELNRTPLAAETFTVRHSRETRRLNGVSLPDYNGVEVVAHLFKGRHCRNSWFTRNASAAAAAIDVINGAIKYP